MHYGKQPRKNYYDFAKPTSENHSVVAVDQQKFNFIWLNYPDLEVRKVGGVPDEVINGVCEYMDRETRTMLKKLPLEFMRYWAAIDNGSALPGLTAAMPAGHMEIMWSQAREAQSRLFKVTGNVVQLAFGRPGYERIQTCA